MSEPFPKLVRNALLWPFGVFAAAYVLALFIVLAFSGAFGTFHI